MTDEQKPIFWVSNHHSADCGEPPSIDGDRTSHYHGYFENVHGEQAIFVFNLKTKIGWLWMGDARWDEPYRVIDGEAPELVLSLEEAVWLQICWYAATGEMPSRLKRAAEPPAS
ncbi:MAG: hypothetical protein AB1435_11885 [Chloroflexota bacterium]|jgi:hypothetical protein